jgi:hypothetical protein
MTHPTVEISSPVTAGKTGARRADPDKSANHQVVARSASQHDGDYQQHQRNGCESTDGPRIRLTMTCPVPAGTGAETGLRCFDAGV